MDTEVPLPERDRADPAPGRDERSRFGVRTQRYALLVVAFAAVIAVVNTFVAQPFEIPSGSMENTLRSGDRVLVNKLAYRFGGVPARGDVVVFDGEGSFVQESGRTDYIKRVIGIGGDRVTCCDRQGRITVNGRPLDETYLYPGDTPSRVAFDIEVAEGRLWVMGDHRADSRDSRDHLGDPGGGTVPVDKVIGRAEITMWPLSRRRSLDGAHG